MSPTQTVPVGNAREVRTVLPSHAGIQHAPIQAPASARTEAAASEPLIAKRVGYGLPCARCKTYYAANLAACHPDRAQHSELAGALELLLG